MSCCLQTEGNVLLWRLMEAEEVEHFSRN